MPKQTIKERIAFRHRVREGKDVAIQYSRELPDRQVSPYGGLATDCPAIQEAFRKLFELITEMDEQLPKGSKGTRKEKNQ